MSRSMKLGHCVCNPQNPCPCDILKQRNICPCAGEKMSVKAGKVALTQHVRKAGCASKIGQSDLLRVISNLPPITDPNVLLGATAGDDAGIYRLDEKYSLVQTVDVFTPCVDDAYLFGQITAANSLSDVYAMGGKPLTALSIVGFPIDELDAGIMEDMLRGGIEKLEEAGCSLLGGHSINDEEIKCGFAVTGLIETDKVVERDQANPGDVLVLTKPLGTGMVAFAAQLGRASNGWLKHIGESMATLNKDAAELMQEFGAHACTDITGYGLAGHLVEMIRGSGVSAEIDFRQLPVFGVVPACLENQIMSGAIERNQEYAMRWIESLDTENTQNLPILYDPQTSGGLLVALPEGNIDGFIKEMHNRGHKATSIIGRIVEKNATETEGKVIITHAGFENLIGEKETIIMSDNQCCGGGSSIPEPVNQASCCDSPPVIEENVNEVLPMFKDFLKAANAPGLIDKKSKKLMAIALSIARHCEPCLKIHIKGAIAMGITKAEIDEAANLAMAFSGCPAMMLYKETCEELGI